MKKKNKKKLKKKIVFAKFDQETFYLASSFFLRRLQEAEHDGNEMLLESKLIGNTYFGEDHDSFSFFARLSSLMFLIANEEIDEQLDNFFKKLDNIEKYNIDRLIAYQIATYPMNDGVFIPSDFINFMEKNYNLD